MSRIDEAWTRATGAVAAGGGIAPRVERFEASQTRPPCTTIRRRCVSGLASTPASRAWSQRTIVAPRTGERRQLGPLPQLVERKLVVSEHAMPIAVEQYRRTGGRAARAPNRARAQDC